MSEAGGQDLAATPPSRARLLTKAYFIAEAVAGLTFWAVLMAGFTGAGLLTDPSGRTLLRNLPSLVLGFFIGSVPMALSASLVGAIPALIVGLAVNALGLRARLWFIAAGMFTGLISLALLFLPDGRFDPYDPQNTAPYIVLLSAIIGGGTGANSAWRFLSRRGVLERQ